MSDLIFDEEEKRYSDILKGQRTQTLNMPQAQMDDEEATYANIFKDAIVQRQEALRQSLLQSVGNNPDQMAQIEALSKQTGIPQPVVERNLATIVTQQRAAELQEAARFSPILAEQLRNPDFAKVAHDDISNLSALEQIVTKGRDYAGSLGKGVVGNTLGGTLSGWGELYGVGVRQLEAMLDQVLPNSVMSFLRTPIPWYLAPEQILKRPGKELKDFGEVMGAPKARQGLDTDVIEGIGQLGSQIIVHLLTGGTASTPMLYGQGADIMAEKTAKDNALDWQRDSSIVLGGAITALTEKYGLDKILNRVPPEIRNRTLRFLADKAAAFGIEFAQELTEGLLHDMTRRLFTKEDAPLLEGALREGTAAGLSAAIVRTALGVRSYRNAAQQEEFFKALADNSANSKLRERLPERFQDLMKTLSERGAVENVYIPANEFRTFFQSQGMDPAAMAAQFGAKNYDEASANNSDIVIPIDEFATRVAPTDYLQGLSQDLRLSQGDMTAREYALYKAEEEARLQEIIARAQEIQGELKTPAQTTIQQQMAEQLAATGYEARTAEAYATVYAKTIVNLAERSGQDPMALHERYGLSVNRPLPEVLTKKTQADIYLDPLLDRLRASDFPTDQQVFGTSLVEFIRQAGGIQAYGELVDADYDNRPFQRNLIQPKGMTADRAAELAVEAGYFPDISMESITEADLFDALDEELRGGSTRYSIFNEDSQLMGLRDQLMQLDDYLRQLNIDINAIADNAVVRDLINQAAQQPEVQDLIGQLYQLLGIDADQTGTENTLFQFAGQQARTANMYALITAQDRLKRGDSTETVRRETGWFRGVDGMWRFEIADNEASFNGKGTLTEEELDKEIGDEIKVGPDPKALGIFKATYREGTEQYRGAFGRTETDAILNLLRSIVKERNASVFDIDKVKPNDIVKLSDALDHPKLFAAYPDLADMQVNFVGSANYRGMYSPSEDAIYMVISNDQDQMLSTLLHEIQHAIQQREGFAKGGNTESSFTDRVRTALDRMEKEARQTVDYWKGVNKEKLDDAEKASELARYGLMWESAQRLIDYSNRDKPSGVFRLIRNELQWIYGPDFRDNEAARTLQADFYAIPKRGAKRNQFISDMAFRGGRLLLDAIPADLQEQFKSDPRTMKGMLAALRRESDKKYKELAPLRELEGNVRKATNVRSAHRFSAPFDIYQALAGEVEARNTQARQQMTDAERKATSPMATADVPAERIVVMFGGLDIRAPMASALDDAAQTQTLFQSDQTDTAGFQAWSKGHPVIQLDAGPVFEAGEPVVVEAIHGTTADVERFDRTKANIESDLGAGFYFSNTPDEIGANYAGLGPDLTNKIERLSEQLEQSMEYDADTVDMSPEQIREEAQRRAREQFMANQGVSMPVYVRFDNPAVLGGNRETFLDYDEAFDPETEEYGEPTGALVRLMEAIREVEQNGEIEMDADAAIGALQQAGMDSNGMTVSEAIEALKKALVYAVDYNTGDSATNEVVRQAFELAGFDGFIDQTVDKKFGSQRRQGKQMQGMNPDTVHFVAFFPQQIASRIGSTWDRGNTGNSILYQGQEINRPIIPDAPPVGDRALEKEWVRSTAEVLARYADQLTGPDNPMFGREVQHSGSKAGPSSYFKFGTTEIRVSTHSKGAFNAAGYINVFDKASADNALALIEKSALDFVQKKAQGRNVYLSRGTQGENLGFIRFGKDRKFNITLLEKADLSTFIHESGHFYLEVLGDLAEMPDASEQIRQDYATVLNFLGATSRADLTLDGKAPGSEEYNRAVAMHEKFARANEAYMMEGKAPSSELREIFRRFRNWLVQIYKSMTALNVELTDEVREVFDRLYATDQEIEAAKNEMAFDPLFLDAAAAGMTQAEFEAYKQTVAQATETGKEALQQKLMKQLQREREAWWKKELGRVRDEVAAEVDAVPVYQAFKALVSGEVKFNKDDLVERYGEDFLKRLPRSTQRVYTLEGGLDPDSVARLLGFASGDVLVEQLASMRPRSEYIKAEADRRMVERHGDMRVDGTIADEAKISMHNEQRAKLLMAELRALRRKQREVAPFVQVERDKAKAARQAARAAAQTPPVEAFRSAAEGMVGQTAVRDLEPQRYLNAQRRNAKIAFDAMAKGDYQTAADAKQKEILNHYMYLAAMKARERADKIAAHMRKLDTKNSRERIGKAGKTYLEQIDAILDGYEFRRIPNRQIDRRASLEAFVKQEKEDGNPVNIPVSLLEDARQINYRSLNIDELEAIYEAVRNIENLARLKNRLTLIAEKRTLDEVAGDAIEHVLANAKGGRAKKLESNLPGEQLGKWAKGFMLIHTKLATLFRQMDGWKDGGMMWDLFVRPLNDRADYEAVQRAEATKKLRELLKPFRDTNMYAKKYLPTLGQSITHQGRLMVALNWGRAENRQRLMDGNGLTQGQIDEILGSLDERDWAFVKGVWEFFDSYWPQIADQYERLYGVAPTKSDALPFDTKFGQMPGGYFPIKYDATKSERATAYDADDIAQQMKSGAYMRSQTKNGFTEEVLQNVDRAVRLDFSSIYEHLGEVIHDMALREYLLDTNKLLNHRVDGRTLKDVIFETYGDQFYTEIRDALKDIAVGDIGARKGFEQAMSHLRAGVSIVGMGWNLMTGLMQPLGLTQSIVRVGPKWVAKGLMKWGTDLVHLENSAKWIYEKSDFMRTRNLTQSREINEIRNQIKRQGKFPIAREVFGLVEDSYFQLIIQFQKVVDIPTWLGAYEKALEAGSDDKRAVALADQAVIDSQGGGSIKDLAAIQRGGPLLKLWTNFYSYFNTTFNLTRESIGRTKFKDPISIGRLAVDLVMLYTVPAILGMALREAVNLLVGGDEPDEEELIDKLIREQLTYIMGSMVGLREASAFIDPRFGYSGPAGARFFAELARFGKQVSQGELDEALLKSGNQLAGILFHYPAGQVQRTIQGIYALEQGDATPAAVVFGAPKQ